MVHVTFFWFLTVPPFVDKTCHVNFILQASFFSEVGNKRILNMEDLTAISNYEKEKIAERNRAKTAPARERRRIWMAESVEIKTERGENRRVKAPGNGCFHGDFNFVQILLLHILSTISLMCVMLVPRFFHWSTFSAPLFFRQLISCDIFSFLTRIGGEVVWLRWYGLQQVLL